MSRSPTFVRIRAAGDGTVVVIDLIADPIERHEKPSAVSLEGREILTESLPDILVNTLCALLSRSEIRDLVDVEAIVSRGGDLDAQWRRLRRRTAVSLR